MGCSNPSVPSYLHYDDGKRKIYKTYRFSFWHLIYRTRYRETPNPIESDKIRAGHSVCWSKLINYRDVLNTVLAANPNLGNSVFFGKVSDFKRVNIKCVCSEGDYAGEHIVKLKLYHKPLECNYSHSEVLIRHIYTEKNLKKDIIIKYEDWQDSLFQKGKPKLFFKELKARYRATVFTILNNELTENNLPFYIRFNPKTYFLLMLAFFKFR